MNWYFFYPSRISLGGNTNRTIWSLFNNHKLSSCPWHFTPLGKAPWSWQRREWTDIFSIPLEPAQGAIQTRYHQSRHLLLSFWYKHKKNKANLRDLIAATGLVILLKLDLNRPFFSPYDLEIWWMAPKNNKAPLLCYLKLFASFRSHWWIQTWVSPETPNLGQNWRFFLAVWPWNFMDDLQKQ